VSARSRLSRLSLVKKSVLPMIAYAAMRFCERALAPFQALSSKKICSSDDRICGDAFL